MSKFPIAEYIHGGLKPVIPQWWPKADPILPQLNFQRALQESALFDFNLASDLYWNGQKVEYNIENDNLGPIRPPYDSMWCEWTVSGNAHGAPMGGKVNTDWNGHNARLACYVATQEFGKSNNMVAVRNAAELTTGVYLLIRPEDRQEVFLSPLPIIIDIDPQTGEYVKDSLGVGSRADILKQATDKFPEEVKGLMNAPLDVLWLGLNLLNCKNVTAPERGQAFARTTREKRQRVPAVRYHTIQLPGMSSRPGSGGRLSKNDEAVMAQHRVRGHFKTYTAEAPLLGKHVGTYWWGWNVRGSKSRGEVISDYSLGGQK